MILFPYNLFADQHRFDYFKPSVNEDDVDNDNGVGDEIIPLLLNLKTLLGLVLLFYIIGYLVIGVGLEGLIWGLVKHLVVKINWLMSLNNSTLHTRLSTESYGQTLYLFNYNVCKHQNDCCIFVGDIIKDQIHLR